MVAPNLTSEPHEESELFDPLIWVETSAEIVDK